MMDTSSESEIEVLSNLFVKNNRGQNISLDKVVDFGETPGAFVIRRINRKRVFSISGTLDKAKLTQSQLQKK